jgi:hypothetical protein
MNSGKSIYRDPLWVIAGTGTVLLFPLLILLLQGHEQVETAQSLCPFMLLTGLPCPGCGMTKSLLFLLNGDIQKSLSYHLFGPAVFVGSLALTSTAIAEMITRKKYFRKILYNVQLAYLLGAALGMYHLTRLILLLYNSSLEDILKASIWK